MLLIILIAADAVINDPYIKRAEANYAAVVKRANEAAAKAHREAAKTRMRVYEKQLKKATMAGDFSQATEIKRRIEQYRKQNSLRPRPKNTVRFGGHTYAFIDEKVTWHVAKRRCEELGGQLVCVESPREAAFVAKLAGHDGERSVWLGATDEENEGRWIWVNGKPISSARWADNHQGDQHHLYVKGRKWDDAPAGWRLAYICEWE